MRLLLDGQRDASAVLADELPAGLPAVPRTGNLLMRGDNLTALRMLLRDGYRSAVDLVYIDPPFATGTTFRVDGERASTISMARGGDVAYADTLTGDAYLEFLRERLIVARELMSDVSSIYLHIDCKVGHCVKLVMDEVFGAERFRGDIARVKCNPKNFARKGFGNVKDMVLLYTKTDALVWHAPRTPYTADDLATLFPKLDDCGRRYTTVPLHAPGETVGGDTGGEFKGLRPPKGRHWRCSPTELAALDGRGAIEWSRTGNPRLRLYADERPGKLMQDIWTYKDPPYPDYPTAKNLEMLKMIVAASSNEGSLVLDFFCGSGTTLVAAQSLGRRWVGVDISPQAIAVAGRRLGGVAFTTIHLPEDTHDHHPHQRRLPRGVAEARAGER